MQIDLLRFERSFSEQSFEYSWIYSGGKLFLVEAKIFELPNNIHRIIEFEAIIAILLVFNIVNNSILVNLIVKDGK